MGSKERIQRLKEGNRVKILQESLKIVKLEGWKSLSMRKIADRIEYTAPMIYEYFPNKDAILSELAKQGNLKLIKRLESIKQDTLEARLESMWLAYWDFAFAEPEYYQLMFGVGTATCSGYKSDNYSKTFGQLFCTLIKDIMVDMRPTEDEVYNKYLTYWSVIHGLISINFTTINAVERTNQQVLKDAITGITLSLNRK